LEDELEAIVLMHKYSKAALYFLLSLQALTASVLAVSLKRRVYWNRYRGFQAGETVGRNSCIV
jgi:hypothetical protein